MTTAAIQDRVDELFTDARNVHAQAIERLQNGDIRDAAEKRPGAPPSAPPMPSS